MLRCNSYLVFGVQAHHWTASITPAKSIAHKGAVIGTKVVAASILGLLTSAKLRVAARKELEEDTKELKYSALLRAPIPWI